MGKWFLCESLKRYLRLPGLCSCVVLLLYSSKSNKYFVKQFTKQTDTHPKSSTDLPPRTPSPGTGSPAPSKATWRLKTRQEYIQSLSASEVRKKGGMAKLQKQQTNRYFKRKKLADIIMLHGNCTSSEERETVGLFAHFLMGKLLNAWLTIRLPELKFSRVVSNVSCRHP